MQCRSHSWRRTSECLFVTACSMDEYGKEKRTEKNLIVRSGISEADTTNNKRLRSTFYIEAIQTRSIARPLCDSRASCYLYSPSSRPTSHLKCGQLEVGGEKTVQDRAIVTIANP